MAVAVLVGTCLVAGSLGTVALAATMLSHTPPDLLGRVQTAAGLSSMVVQPLGPLAAGLLLEHTAPRTAFAVFAAVIGICLLVAVSRRPQPFPNISPDSAREGNGRYRINLEPDRSNA